MKLTREQIESIATGITYTSVTEEGRISLHRFSSAEEEIYREIKPDFYGKVFCNAGMKLSFKTDSRKLGIKGFISGAVSRNYMALQVFADGKPIGEYNNYSHLEIPKVYVTLACEVGEMKCEFELGEGEKHIEVYLPWSVRLAFDEITLDDGATVTPVKRNKLLLAYGDSITQGYDAMKPYNRYSSLLAEALGADEHNKAIGGEIFFPALANAADSSLRPDYITVAYGTNDWNGRRDTELFKVHVRGFFEGIREAYPSTPIFALMPIWRKEAEVEKRALGSLEKLGDLIADITAGIPNLHIVQGYDTVPHSEDYFADLHLHPNDAGYAYQAKGFGEKIKKLI